MKEYQTCVENKQVDSNNLLRSARNQIECAFGRLKARWRLLTRTVDLKFEIVPAVVYRCFFLRNFCESKNYSGPDEKQNNINLCPTPFILITLARGSIYQLF